MRHSYTSYHMHFVWGTKHRIHSIQPQIQKVLYDYVTKKVNEKPGCLLIAVGGISDHIHLLVRLPGRLSPAGLVRSIKYLSSKFIKNNFPEIGFSWQKRYGAFAVSVSLVDRVKRYIDHQKEHHKERSFKEEFEDFLKKNNLVIAEGFWDDNDEEDDDDEE